MSRIRTVTLLVLLPLVLLRCDMKVQEQITQEEVTLPAVTALPLNPDLPGPAGHHGWHTGYKRSRMGDKAPARNQEAVCGIYVWATCRIPPTTYGLK